MNKNSFIKFIENSRDCGGDRLDNAVRRGIRKAKNENPDARKFFLLAAAGVFTVAMCFTVNLRPFVLASESYCRNRIEMMPGSAEAFESYIKDMAYNVKKYFGGI